MLHVILQILAIIGIVLLCILGLLLLVILLILFVPIRYRVRGNKQGEDIFAEGKVTYLLHLISVKFTYNKESRLLAKIFGFKVYDSAKKTDNVEKADSVESTNDTKAENPFENTASGENASNDENVAMASKAVETKSVKSAENVDNTDNIDNKNDENNNSTENTGKLSWFTKIKNKIKDIIQKIKYTIISIYDKIKNITETISYYKEVLTDTENRKLFKRVLERLGKVLKSIRPRVLKADLRIGTGSPDTTGYLCAVYGMLLPVLGEHVKFTADFEEAVVEGTFFAKGRITVFTILVQAAKVFFDNQLRTFIKQLKREEQ